MAKIHPLPIVEVDSSSYDATSKRDSISFTVWMKSLVMQGNGCTVYNENGEVVYRMDNYDKKGSGEVYLMDLKGNVLFTIIRRARFWGHWKGYKGDGTGSDLNKEKPRFQVSKKGQVTLLSNNDDEACCYRLEASAGNDKSALLKIIECRRGRGDVVVAEARRKLSTSGVLLGDDVFTLVVEPHVDHSFIIALVTVHGLMHRKL